MNPDAPRTPREELEIQITALLMGQLSAEDAAKTEALIAADHELVALRNRLQQAANLLREARALPDASAAGEAMRLSKDRREKLLATFRGIKALPAAIPASAPASIPVARRKSAWKKPLILAASIAVLLTGTVFLFSEKFATEQLASRAMEPRGIGPDHSLLEVIPDTDFAPASPNISYAPHRYQEAAELSKESARYAMDWSSQRGAIQSFGEKRARPNLSTSSTTSSQLSLGGKATPRPLDHSTPQRPATSATGGVYLPPIEAASEHTTMSLAGQPANAAGAEDFRTAFGNGRLDLSPERFDTFSDSSKLDTKALEGRATAGARGSSLRKLGIATLKSEVATSNERQFGAQAHFRQGFEADGAEVSNQPQQPPATAAMDPLAQRERLLAESSQSAEKSAQTWDVTRNWSGSANKQAGGLVWSAQVDPASANVNDPTPASGGRPLETKSNKNANAPAGDRDIADLVDAGAEETVARAKVQAPVPASAPADAAALAPEDTSLSLAFAKSPSKGARAEVRITRSGESDIDTNLGYFTDGSKPMEPQPKSDLYSLVPKAQTATTPGTDPAQQQFVEAFLAVRKAEEKAAAGDTQAAQEGLQSAAKSLEQIKQQWPKWQPELVEFRLKRTQDSIRDLEAKAPAKEGEVTKPVASAGDPPTPAAAPVPPPVPQPEISTAENAFSTFSLNVSDVSYQLAAASLDKGQMPDPGAIRSEEFVNAFNYRDPEPAPGSPFAFASERARYPFAHNRDLLRLSLKTAAVGREAGRPLNLVLVIDNSGSMERADRVTIMKEALRVLATQLKPQDKLSLITFSRAPRLWADGVPGDKAAEHTQRVGEMTPEGGTDLSAALDLGYQTALKHYAARGINRVVLLTDGAANLGDVKPDALKAKVEKHRRQGVAFDCFGVGWEGYNDDLLEQLSRNGDGRYGFINSPEAAARDFAGQLAGALRPAASDVKVQVEFNPRRVLHYRQIGYAKHQLTKEQFRDNTVDAAEMAAAESGNALYTVEVNPRGEGDIATVRARFKVPGTAEYHEHAWTVPYQAPALALEQSSSSLRLAATAAAFSEMLAQSPHASEVTSDRLLQVISGIPAIYGPDPRPAKLEAMIRQAKSLSGR